MEPIGIRMPTENPFSNIQTILSARELIDVVFHRAMKAMSSGGESGISNVVRVRRLEAKRVELGAKLFRDRLLQITYQFPNIDELHMFYQEMVDIIVGIDRLRQILGSFRGTAQTIWRIHREHISQIWHEKALNAKKERKAAFSRYESVIMQLDDRFNQLRDITKQLQSLPAFNFDNYIVVVAGYPNTGKSSFISQITRATPEIANYPFTTKQVSIGHYEGEGKYKYFNCQVVDTPGLLDRTMSARNRIEIRAITAIKYLSKTIIFFIDPVIFDQIQPQLNLFKELQEELHELNFLIIINKIDLCTEEYLASVTEYIAEGLHTDVFTMISALDQTQCHLLMQNIFESLLSKRIPVEV